MSSPTSREVFRFGIFELDTRIGELRRSGVRIRLQEKPLQVLMMLLEHHGDIVTREELRQRLWPEETFLEFDDNLNTAISKLRNVLGDTATSARYVETLRGRGYRFLGQVETPSVILAEPAAVSNFAKTILRLRRTKGVAIGGAIAVVVAVVVTLMLTTAVLGPLELESITPLTTTPGLESRPKFSPDGTRVAFTSDALGNMDVWVRQLVAGPPVVLTRNHEGYDGNPVWSPDGSWIAFASDREGGGIFVMTALGGPPRRLLALAIAPDTEVLGSVPTLAWSPDGSSIACATGIKQERALMLVPSAGGAPQPVALPLDVGTFSVAEPAFSPDGKRVAFVGVSGSGTTVARIWTVRTDGTDLRAVTSGDNLDHCPMWSRDGRRLLFVSDRGGTPDIWWLPISAHGRPSTSARPLTVGVGIDSFATAPGTDRLVYAQAAERSTVWKIPLDKLRDSILETAAPMLDETHVVEHIDVARGSRRWSFDSNRSGNADIWILESDGEEPWQVTTDPGHDWHPELSPGGDRVVFHSLRDGNREIYISELTGDAPRRLTDNPAKDWLPTWSFRENVIAFESDRSGNPDIWIVEVDGSETRALTIDPANDHNPLFSPTDDRLIFSSTRAGGDELFVVRLDRQAAPEQLTHHGWFDVVACAWDPESDVVYAWGRTTEPRSAAGQLWQVHVRDGSVAPIGSLPDTGWNLAPSAAVADGHLYLLSRQQVANLWRAELREQ